MLPGTNIVNYWQLSLQNTLFPNQNFSVTQFPYALYHSKSITDIANKNLFLIKFMCNLKALKIHFFSLRIVVFLIVTDKNTDQQNIRIFYKVSSLNTWYTNYSNRNLCYFTKILFCDLIHLCYYLNPRLKGNKRIEEGGEVVKRLGINDYSQLTTSNLKSLLNL